MKVPLKEAKSAIRHAATSVLGIVEFAVKKEWDEHDYADALLQIPVVAVLDNKYDDVLRAFEGEKLDPVAEWLMERRGDVLDFVNAIMPSIASALSGMVIYEPVYYPAPSVVKQRTGTYLDLPSEPVPVPGWMIASVARVLAGRLRLRLEGNDVAVASLDGAGVEVAMPLGLVGTWYRNASVLVADVATPVLERHSFERDFGTLFRRKVVASDVEITTEVDLDATRISRLHVWVRRDDRSMVLSVPSGIDMPKYFASTGEIAEFAERVAEVVAGIEKKVAGFADNLLRLKDLPNVRDGGDGIMAKLHTNLFNAEAKLVIDRGVELAVDVKFTEPSPSMIQEWVAVLVPINAFFTAIEPLHLEGAPFTSLNGREGYHVKATVCYDFKTCDADAVNAAIRAFATLAGSRLEDAVEAAEKATDRVDLASVVAASELLSVAGLSHLAPRLTEAGHVFIYLHAANLADEPLSVYAEVTRDLEVMVNGVWLRDILTAVGGLDATRAREIERELALKMLGDEVPVNWYHLDYKLDVSDAVEALLDPGSPNRDEILSALLKVRNGGPVAKGMARAFMNVERVLSLDDERFAEFAIVTAPYWIEESGIRVEMLKRVNALPPELARRVANEVRCHGDWCLVYIPSKGGVVLTFKGVIVDPAWGRDRCVLAHIYADRRRDDVVAYLGQPVAYYVARDDLFAGKPRIRYVDAREEGEPA